MEVAVCSVPDEPINGVMSTPVWLVFQTAAGPEVVGPVHLRCTSNVDLLLPDFETQEIWI